MDRGISAAEFYSNFIDVFQAWAEGVDDIRAAFIIGSQAREDHPADIWSDMDILMFTSNPDLYLRQSEWQQNLGNVLCSFSTYTAGGDPERLTLFAGGYQVDFVVSSANELTRLAAARKVHKNFYRGVRMLVDKDQVSHHIMPERPRKLLINPISAERFDQTCNMFWFVVLYLAKQVLRGDLWVVKSRDTDLKALLLQMCEWYERCMRGEDHDTWHAGRFMYEWLSADIYERLQACFGSFDAAGSWQALIETTLLFKELSHKVAVEMNYPGVESERFVEEWLKEHGNQLINR